MKSCFTQNVKTILLHIHLINEYKACFPFAVHSENYKLSLLLSVTSDLKRVCFVCLCDRRRHSFVWPDVPNRPASQRGCNAHGIGVWPRMRRQLQLSGLRDDSTRGTWWKHRLHDLLYNFRVERRPRSRALRSLQRHLGLTLSTDDKNKTTVRNAVLTAQ